MRIAVIGGGVSGLSAAWALSKNNRVVLYEAEPRLGGHANTLDIEIDGTGVPVDAGFIVYNEQNYPNLINLFDTLGVRTELSDMSFSVSIGGGQFEYGGSNRALVAQPLNLLKPFYWKMLLDLKRFYGEASGHLATLGDARFQSQALTIQGFLDQQGYSKAFADLHLLPMAAAIWSSSTNQIRQFPAESFIRFYENHGLFNITNRPKWRTVSGGSRTYVDRIANAISEAVRIGMPVVSLERTPVGVTVIDKSGNSDHFDQVVMATHADNSLRMLGQSASPLERKVLGGFVFQPNSAVIHTDTDLMPRRKAVWSSWNYLADDSSQGDRLVSLTYWMNPLQNLETPRPLFISLNAHREPDPETVLGRVTYRHPLMSPDTLRAQGELPGIQGHLGTWHCGAWTGYGFHEDGAQAGFAIASALGSPTPWQNDIVPMSPSVDIVGTERLQGVA